MTDILIGLPLLALVMAVLGWGWAKVVPTYAPAGFEGDLFVAWIMSAAIAAVATSWTYAFNISIVFWICATCGISATGYVVAIVRRGPGTLVPRCGRRAVVALLGSMTVAMVALTPAVASTGALTVGQRIGPDAIGWAIASSTFGQDVRSHTVQQSLLHEVGGPSAQADLSPVTKRVDRAPSFTVQVQNEFLTGAGRWSYPELVGAVEYVLGPSHLWSALSLFAALGYLVTCFGMWIVIVARTGSRFAALIGVVLFGFSSVLLNSWYEGGIGELWVAPVCILFALAILNIEKPKVAAGATTLALSTLIVLPTFNEELFALALVLALAAVLAAPRLRGRSLKSWGTLLVGIVVGALIVLPSSVLFLETVSKSVGENGSAGWTLPTWLSLADATGMRNVFVTSTPGLVSGSLAPPPATEIVQSIVVTVFLVLLGFRRLFRPAGILLWSVLLSVGAVYVKTRYLDHASNYQYFKTIAILVPIAAIAIGELCGTAWAQQIGRRRGTVDAGIRAALLILGAYIGLTVAVSGVGYLVKFRQTGTALPATYSALGNPEARAAFQRYNVLWAGLATDPNRPDPGLEYLQTMAIGADANLYLLGRTYGKPPVDLSTRIEHPVALSVLASICPRYRCLDRVPRSAIVFESPAVALVQVSSSTTPLTKMPEAQWSLWAIQRFDALGGTIS